MRAVVGTYSGKGAKDLVDVLEKHKADVEKLIRSVKGLVSYTLARSAGEPLRIEDGRRGTGVPAFGPCRTFLRH